MDKLRISSTFNPLTRALLRTLPRDLERKILRAAVRAGLKPVQLIARQLSPRRTGQFRRSISISTRRRGSDTVGRVRARSRIAGIVEKGTQERRTRAGALRGRVTARHIIRKSGTIAGPKAASIIERMIRERVWRRWTTGQG